MKKFIILFVLVSASLMAKTIEIKSDGAVVYDSEKWREAKKIGSVAKGTKHQVVAEYGDWVKVEVVSGSMHAGKTGYFCAFEEFVDLKTCVVVNKGLTLRSSPRRNDNGTPADTADDDNFIAKVAGGAKFKVIGLVVTRYKIENGWVTATHAAEIK